MHTDLIVRAGLDSTVSGVSLLAFGSSQARFLGRAPFTSSVTGEKVSTEYCLTARVKPAQVKCDERPHITSAVYHGS